MFAQSRGVELPEETTKFIEVTVKKLNDTSSYNDIPIYIYDTNYCNGVYTKNSNGTYNEVSLSSCTYSGLEDTTVAYVKESSNNTEYTYYIDVTGFTQLHYLGYSNPRIVGVGDSTGDYRKSTMSAFYYSKIVIPDNITNLEFIDGTSSDSYYNSQGNSTLCCCSWSGYDTEIDLSGSGVTSISAAFTYYHDINGMFADFLSSSAKSSTDTNSYGTLILTLPSNLSSLGTNSMGYSNIESITIPSSCVTIGNYAFRYCGDLISITAHNNISSMGREVFNTSKWWSYGRSSGDAVELNNWLLGVYNLTTKGTVTLISTNVTKVAQYAFYQHSYISEIVPTADGGNTATNHNITHIYNYAFYGCPYFDAGCILYLDNSVQYISNYAFSYSGTSLTLGQFDGSSTITGTISVYFGSACNSIGYAAFQGCSKLQQINFENSTSLGQYAFSGCTEIYEIYCYEGCRPVITVNSFGNSSTTYVGINSIYRDEGYSNILAIYHNDEEYFTNSDNYWVSPILTESQSNFAISYIDSEVLPTTTTTTTTSQPGTTITTTTSSPS